VNNINNPIMTPVMMRKIEKMTFFDIVTSTLFFISVVTDQLSDVVNVISVFVKI
jgi:hypothetical protein